jgi:serine/threonine-protein kinase HipA
MRAIEIYRNGILAGLLKEIDAKHFVFTYDDLYYNDASKPAISLTLPKLQKEYQCDVIFPFFSNMIAEGENKKMQSQLLKIDENDQFGLLLATAQADTIGNITVKEIKI